MSAASYLAPNTLDEVADILQENPQARVLAGGHSLLLQINRAHLNGCTLVDLGRVKGLSGISLQADATIQIGAMTTLDAITRDELIRTQFPTLAESLSWVGDCQLRNRATIGGSLADAIPESDVAPLLMALGATVAVGAGATVRSIPMDEFYVAEGRTALGPKEIITSVTLPQPQTSASFIYERIKHPATLYALAGVAVSVAFQNGRNVTSARIAATGASTYPVRLKTIENAIIGKTLSADSIADALKAFPQDLTFRSDLFGSGEYRRHLLQVLTGRALNRTLSASA